MKKECGIVQDLLFGYNDEILSSSSKELVEEHLKDCIECKKVLEEIKKDIKNKSENKEVDYLKKIRDKMNRKSILITITTILLILLIIFNIIAFINYKNYAENIEIYLSDDITQNQLLDIEESIKNICNNAEVTYNSKEQELEKMKEKFGENSNLLSGYDGVNNIFPASYKIKAELDKIEVIKNKLKTMPGIEKIVVYTDTNPYLLLYFSLKNNL